jgi:gliding motility-associated-like protein
MNSRIKKYASWFMASFLALLSLISFGQNGIKVNDGAFMKVTSGTYIKVTGTDAGVIIDTNSTLNSDASWSIDGDFSGYGSVNLNSSQIDLQGNWLNKGSFNGGSSLLRFLGSTNQSILHQGNSLYNIEIQKSANEVDLLSNVGVSNQVLFTNGMVNTSKDTLILGSSGNLANETNGNYALGYVRTSRTVNSSIENFGQLGIQLDATGTNQNLGSVTVTRAAGLLKKDTSYIVSSDNASRKSIDRIWTFSAQHAPSDSVDLIFNWIQDNDNGNTDLDSMYIYYKKSEGIWDSTGPAKDGTSRSVAGKTLTLSSITIAPKLSLPFKAKFSADTICLGAATSFKDSSTVWGTGITYSWDFNNDGTIESTTNGNVSYTYPSSGVYYAKLKITNSEGAKDSLLVQVLVQGQMVASFIPNTVCVGVATEFTNESTSFSGVNYSWDFNSDGTVDNTSTGSVSYTYSTAGTYKAILVLTTDHCISKDTVDVTVNESPTVNAGNNKEVQAGTSVTLQPVYSGNIQKYSWTPSTYLDNASATSPVSSPLDDISYTITVTSAKGCTASDDITIHVIKELFIPTGFTPDNDGANDVWEIPDLKNYPNATIQVFDRAGQKIFEGNNTSSWDGTYDGKASPTGAYFFIITPGNDVEPVSCDLTLIRLVK